MEQTADEVLQALRREMRAVTSDIIVKIQERIEIASRIGDLKRRMDLDIRDEKAAQEIRDHVISVAEKKGLRLDFALQILNVLLLQSELIQGTSRAKPASQTHLAVFSRAKQLEQAGKKIIHMEVGEPDYGAPTSAGLALSEAFSRGDYRYTDTLGIAKLKASIAEKEESDETEVIVTPGGRFSIFAAITGLLKPGDELLIFEPAWPAYKECAHFASVSVNVVRTDLDKRWLPDLAVLERSLTPNTKMIAINYPNNPTGVILPPKVMDEIVRMASVRGIYLLSDEVYSFYANPSFKSLRKYEYEKGIVVQSFSKTYAMTGFRIGYSVAKSNIIDSMRKVQAAAVTSVPEPVQYAALAVIKDAPQNNFKIMQERLRFVCSRLQKMSLRFEPPAGAMYVFPELNGTEDVPFVESMLEKGVALAPGSGFGDSYSKFVRISACQPEEVLAQGLDMMAKSLNPGR